MGHVYATVTEANDYETSGGSTKFASESAVRVALKRAILESVSQRIDDVCHRSGYGSGFGPRVGTNRYDGDGGCDLWLKDDLLSLTTITLNPSTASSTSYSPVVDTDYYLRNADGYTGPPWRRITLHGQGSPAKFGSGLRVSALTGTWGHSNTTVLSSATTSEALDTSETGVDVSAGTAFAVGHTILIDSEQMYVTAISGNTLTVVRAANGTTAATHLTAAAISIYTYDARVHEVALRLYLRRWRARDGGADGTDAGLDVSGVTVREGEDTIIRRALSDLMFVGPV